MTSLASKLSTTNSAWNITQNRANDSKFLMFFEGKIWIVTANLFYFESISILNKNSSKCRYNLLKVDLRTRINFQNVELLLEMYMVISKKDRQIDILAEDYRTFERGLIWHQLLQRRQILFLRKINVSSF